MRAELGSLLAVVVEQMKEQQVDLSMDVIS